MTGRRLLVLLVALAAIGIPAGILQALCVGGSCDEEREPARVPFCSLPAGVRTAIADGYREGRSPDVLAVADARPVFTEIGGVRASWPSAQGNDARVPVVFWGAGVTPHLALEDGVTLDRIAPTLAEIYGFERPFPEVRSGISVDEAIARDEELPRLLLVIAWKWTGTRELEARPDGWRFLGSLRNQGAGTLEAGTGSLPLDPAAALATIGTGGLPFQHGMTGSFVRNDDGEVVEAFGAGSPVPVIASLADDLEAADPRTLVGLVASEERDRGLVGGGWYPGQDPVDTILGDAGAAPMAVEALLASGFGADVTPDVLGVVLDGNLRRLDRLTATIVRLAEAATDGAVTVVVAGTGTWEGSRLALVDADPIDAVEDAIPGAEPAIAATVPGGLFLDQDVLRREQVTGQVAIEALLSARGATGERMFADAFQGFAVSFARYC